MPGLQWLAEGWATESLDSPERVQLWLIEGARLAGLTIHDMMVHALQSAEQSGPGVTGIAMLKESHMAVHTWPEYGYVTFDVYSCREFDWGAVEKLSELIFQVTGWHLSTTTSRWGPQ
jgi:S-adenosylmethionine decarboxylase proenzyme